MDQNLRCTFKGINETKGAASDFKTWISKLDGKMARSAVYPSAL